VTSPILFGLGHDRALGEALTEHLLSAVPVAADASVVDVLADGVLSRALQTRLGPQGRLIIVEPGTVRERLPLDDASADAVFSLLTLGFGNAPPLLAEMRRVARRPGAVAALVYDASHPPAQEAPLLDALREHGVPSPFYDQLLPEDLLDAAREDEFTAESVRDVARFDGPAHYWNTMVVQRELAADLQGLDADTVAALQASVARSLRPHLAADDTLRIPVTAVLLRGAAAVS